MCGLVEVVTSHCFQSACVLRIKKLALVRTYQEDMHHVHFFPTARKVRVMGSHSLFP